MTWPLLCWSRRPFVAQFTLSTRGTVRSMIGRAARHAGCVTREATLRRPEDREIPVKPAAVASPFADALRWAVIPVDALSRGRVVASAGGPGPVPRRSRRLSGPAHAA